MKGWAVRVVSVAILVAGACSNGDGEGAQDGGATASAAITGPQVYSVLVDRASPQAKNIQLSAYFPATVKARPGDTIIFDNRSSQAPHTITFGVESDRSNSPVPLTPGGDLNPVVFGPCYVAVEPTADLEACPVEPGATVPTYDGVGYWNSGILSLPGSPPEAPPTSAEVVLGDDVAEGTYTYVCLLHAFMEGTIEVVAADEDRLLPEDVAQQSVTEARAAEKSAAAIEDATAEAGDGSVAVAAGWGDELAAVNRFNPIVVTVKAGQTVSWIPLSPYEPHTVTFESPFTNPEQREVFIPGGVRSGSDYTGGFSNSGAFGKGPFPPGPFTLRFPEPGEYPYVCVLHPGMGGSVKVT